MNNAIVQLRFGMKYSVKSKSPFSFVFPIATMIGASFAPLEGWVQFALMGIAGGAIGGFATKPFVRRIFDPADAPIDAKRRLVVIFAIFKLVFGFLIILVSSLIFADWLSPAFVALGGYLSGSTLATPLSAAELTSDKQDG